jgi:WD40 repeat protein
MSLLKVQVERPGHAVLVRRFASTTIVIGRATDCDLVLDDPSVSRRHCRLTRGAEGWLVEDLGSANGTLVDDARADPVLPVSATGALTVGEFRLTLATFAEPPPPPRPARSVPSWTLTVLRHGLVLALVALTGLAGWTAAALWDAPLDLPAPSLTCPAEDPTLAQIDAALARAAGEPAEDAVTTILDALRRSHDLPAACALRPRIDAALALALDRLDHQRLGRHDAPVRALAPVDDARVAALDRDGQLTLWHRHDPGRPLTTTPESPPTLVSLASSPGARWLAAGSDDGRLFLWDLSAPDLAPLVLTARHALTALAFTDDTRLWTADSAGALAVWAHDSNWTRTAAATAWPDVDTLLPAHDGRVIACGAGRAAVWSGDRRPAAQLITGAPLRALAIARTADDTDIIAGDEAGKVTRWRLARTLRPEPLTSHGGPIRALAAHDGLVASIGEDDALRLVELDRRVRRHSGPPLVLLAEVPVPVDRLTIAGTTLFGTSPEGTLVTWDLSQRTRRLPAVLHEAHRGPISALARTPAFAVTGGHDGAVRLWPTSREPDHTTPLLTRACVALGHPAACTD